MRLLDRAYGLGRSLLMYYGRPGAGARLDAFYRPFVPPGALCFDIGAHVGSRTRSFRRLGARVVAVEPQPDFARLLRLMFRHVPGVVVRQTAVAAAPGSLRLEISPRTPTVSTGSPAFIRETTRVPSFAWVAWSEAMQVPATTLDALIAEHGLPDFTKIDVEGMEDAVLAGLSQPLPALSFEFIPASLGSAFRSLDRLEALGLYRYNVAWGEDLALTGEWRDAAAMRAWLQARAPEENSGDIYARLESR